MLVTASSRMEKYILDIHTKFLHEVSLIGYKVTKDSVTAWENNYMEVKCLLKAPTGGINFYNKGFTKHDTFPDKPSLEDHLSKSFGTDGIIKIYVSKKVAWVYIHCPLSELEKDAGRKIPVDELLKTLQEWGAGHRDLSFEKKNSFKELSYETAKKGDEDQMMLFIERRWNTHNAKHFEGKLKRPTFQFKRSNASAHGTWWPSKQTLELNKGMFNTDEHHFDEVLLHEMCHQAVTEISKVSSKDEGAQGHGPVWSKWMIHCGLKPERYANYEQSIQLKGHKEVYESGIKGLKEVDEADAGDLVKWFNLKTGEWMILKILSINSNTLTAMDDKHLQTWRFKNISSMSFWPVDKKNIKNLK